jgi:predicted metalloendopeptidase
MTKKNKVNKKASYNNRQKNKGTIKKRIVRDERYNIYENTKGSGSFKYIKMPYIETSKIDSGDLLSRLKNIETNKESINTEKSVVKLLDETDKLEKKNKLDPRKDFYTYVNYAWMKQQDIVLNYEKYYFIKLDSFRFVQNTVNYRVVQLAKEYSNNNTNATAKKVANIIKSMNHSNLTMDKLKPHINDVIKNYDSYVNNDDLIGYLAHINRCEIISWGCPISWSVYHDEKDAVNIRSHIQCPSLSFYDYDLYITGSESNKYTNKFREEFASKFCEFVESLYDTMLGKGHGLNPRDVIECEIDILKAMDCFSKDDSPDFYNVVTKKDSMNLYKFDWVTFAKGLGYTNVPESYITGNKSYIRCIMSKLNCEWKTPKWKAYWYYMYLRQLCLYEKNLHKLRFEFFKKYAKGQQGIIPESLFSIFALSYCFNTLISRLYVEKYVKVESIYITRTMGEELRKVFIRIINENTWLQPDTKVEALRKLESISIETVYPKFMIEDFNVDYPKDDAYGIMYTQSQAMREYYINNEGKHFSDVPTLDFTVNGGLGLSGTQPYIVNAFYNPVRNNIYVPAATLEEPFIKLNSKGLEYNLAHIGYTFGHEFSHCLDNSGRLFDHKGNMRNWWQPEDEKIFNNKVKDVIKQYELFASWDGIDMDASTMVGESMADISGLEICINYLNNYLNETDTIEKIKETSFREFFIYVAYQWREAIYKQSVHFNIKTNPHPLVKYRTNCPLSRSMIFKRLYNIKKGDHMYWDNDTIWSNNKN